MGPDKLLTPFFFVIICLMAGALLKAVLKKTPLPYSVGLFVFGIILGILDRTGVLAPLDFLSASVHYAGDMNPDLILYIFLPVLIFDAAYELDAHVFRKTLTNAALLSVPGVVIVMFLTALLLMGIESLFPGHTGWTWTYALMFGALISATDPVAVVALLKELRTSKRFSTLVDAESMLNDGTGIVLFMLFFGVYTAEGAPASPVLDFIFVVAGGVLLGVLLAAFCIAFVNKVRAGALVQNSIIIMAAYLTFLLAQDYLNVSGVIALVGFGLTITYYGGVRLSPEVNRFMREFWELAAYIANTLIFILVGIVIAVKVDFTLLDVAFLLVVYVGINLTRIVMIALLYPVMARSGYGLSKREAVILSWGGLRGALGLTLALMVSYTAAIPETIREHILFLTAGIVTLTLLVNATTMRWLLSRLGLTKVSSARLLLDDGVNKRMEEDAIRYVGVLKGKEDLRNADWEAVERFLPPEVEVRQASVALPDVAADIRLRALDKEKSVCWSLFSEGAISSATMRRLNYMIDELYDGNGNIPLTGKGDILDNPGHLRRMTALSGMKLVNKWFGGYIQEKWTAGYDLAEGFILLQNAALKFVGELGVAERLSEDKEDALQVVESELRQNIADGEKYILRLAKDYPGPYRRGITRRASRMLLVREKQDIEMFLRQGMITPDDAREMLDKLEERRGKSSF